MWLFYSPFHTFIHKVLVTAHEAGLWEDITFVPTYPFKNRDGEDQGEAYAIDALNPLDKVPTLVTAEGQPIFGSQAVVEYLDANNKVGRRLYPADGPARWDALTRLALCDQMFELTVHMVMEGWHPPENQRRGLYEWIWPKIIGGLDMLEDRAAAGFEAFDIGHCSMLHCLSYIVFRSEFYEADDPIHPNFNWREGRPNLNAWWDEATQRPSVKSHYMKDFVGEDSPAFCQQQVAAAVAARQR